MKNIQFSAGLLQQLGVMPYLSRPAYLGKALNRPIGDGSGVSEPHQESHDQVGSAVDSQPDSKFDTELMSLPSESGSIVLLGVSLNSIFQDETKPEWLLMQNICQAFGWTEEQLRFFDTDVLASEESIFTTMEEIIEIGVEWVLSMDSDHPITEQLCEGVHVVEVPDLEQMLSDPYAKQTFYQAVSPLLFSP